MAENNPGTETPPFSDVYVPQVVNRRTAIKTDAPLEKQKETLARSQQPRMEFDENTTN